MYGEKVSYCQDRPPERHGSIIASSLDLAVERGGGFFFFFKNPMMSHVGCFETQGLKSCRMRRERAYYYFLQSKKTTALSPLSKS